MHAFAVTLAFKLLRALRVMLLRLVVAILMRRILLGRVDSLIWLLPLIVALVVLLLLLLPLVESSEDFTQCSWA